MDTHSDKRRGPPWIKIVLALSLAVNLAIAGMVAGFVLRGGPDGARRSNMGYATPYVRALPGELRREVFERVRGDDSLPDRRARRGDYRAMIKALDTSPFDAGAVQAVLARQSDAASRVQAAGQAAWLQVVMGLSDAERARYVVRLEEEMQRNGPRKRDGAPNK